MASHPPFPNTLPLPAGSPPAGRQPRWAKRQRGFTILELLAGVGIMVILLGIAIPAYTSIKDAGDITKAASDIAGALEQARTYAMANNTYVWVGFFEEPGDRVSQTPAVPGVGRVVVAVAASRDGARYRDVTPSSTTPAAFGAGDASNPVSLVLLNSVVKIENTHLASLNDELSDGSGNRPPRPPVKRAYQMGDATFGTFNITATQAVTSPTTFSYPATGPVQYTFSKIVEFNPLGEATKIVDGLVMGPQEWMEIATQPTHGSTIDGRYAGTNKAAVAIQVEGLTSRIRIFRL
jgi:prepilin-type N-terminal cleavage/methylation domain-containing protein